MPRCPDAQQRVDMHHGWCKHKLAVELFKDTQEQAEAPEQTTPADTRSIEERVKDLF